MPELGRIAYEAYCRSSGGVSLVSGAKLPEWGALSAEIRAAWDAAAQAVLSGGSAEIAPGELTVEQLQERVSAGDWRDELLKAWSEGHHRATAQLLNKPDVDHFVLVWFCDEFTRLGHEISLLADEMETAQIQASAV